MKGVILAAGKGSRLFPVTHEVPKPLLPLGGKPTIEHAFDRLKEMGVTDICVVVGENEPKMRAALGDGSDYGISLSYARQEEPKGLAHAVAAAQAFIGHDPFVVYLGDAIYSDGFAHLRARFEESGCANLNLVKRVEDPRRFGVANVEGDRIVKLVEKPPVPESDLAMAGLYFFGSEFWTIMPKLKPSARGELEITDAIQLLVDDGFVVLAGLTEAVWFDTGTLDSFLETNAFLLDGGSAVLGTCTGSVGANVAIGDGAAVDAPSIEDSVVLPGAKVTAKGPIRHALLAGNVEVDGAIENLILHGDHR